VPCDERNDEMKGNISGELNGVVGQI